MPGCCHQCACDGQAGRALLLRVFDDKWFLVNVLTRYLDPLRMANMSRWNDDDSIMWILRLAAENGREYCVPDFPAIADSQSHLRTLVTRNA